MSNNNWKVVRPGELWSSANGVFDINYVALSQWRLTEVVRIKATFGVRLVVMEHDRDFKCPQEATLHVSRLLGTRRREAEANKPKRGVGGIIGHGGRPKKQEAA
jgi:hypothetical protein